MRFQLPDDIWWDVLDWLRWRPRRMALAEKLGQLGDRQFSRIVQEWLHKKCTNVRLAPLCFIGRANSQMMVGVWEERWRMNLPFPIADTEMPENIVDFTRIQLRQLAPTPTMLAFLQLLRSLLSHHVNLDASECAEEQLHNWLPQLFPLLTGGIDHFHCGFNNCQLLSYFHADFPALFHGVRLLQLSQNQLDTSMIELLTNWLGTGRTDGQQRMLILHVYSEDYVKMLEQIKEDFLLPNTAVTTFFVHLCSPALLPGHGEEETIETNAVNDEQLIVRPWMDSSLLIARCPAQVNAEWLTEKMEALKTFDFYSLRGLILLKPHAEC